MPTNFSESGLSFQYPENWKLEHDEIENGWLATVLTPDTSFFMLCCRDDCPTAAELADEALEDLRESYPQLEAEPGSSTIAGRVAHGHDVRLFPLRPDEHSLDADVSHAPRDRFGHVASQRSGIRTLRAGDARHSRLVARGKRSPVTRVSFESFLELA